MQHVTYQELIDRFGVDSASSLLKIVEEHASAQADIIALDKHERFDRAIQALSDINSANLRDG